MKLANTTLQTTLATLWLLAQQQSYIAAVLGFSPTSLSQSSTVWRRKQKYRHLPNTQATDYGLHGQACDECDTLNSLMEKLERYLSQRRGQVKSGDNDNDDNIRLSLYQTRLDNICLSNAILKPSSIHGRGLFASSDSNIRKGDLITCYPADALVSVPPAPFSSSDANRDDDGDNVQVAEDVVDKSSPFCDSDQDWVLEWAHHVAADEQLDRLTEELKGYIVDATGEVGALGLPSLDSNPSYLGHFANDGAVAPTCQEELVPYILDSSDKANAVHKSLLECHLVTIATRDIQEGEEILVTYGPQYWMDANDIDGDEDEDEEEY